VVVVTLIAVGAFVVAPTARDCLTDALARCGENDAARYLRAAGSGLLALAAVIALVGLRRGRPYASAS
jgi:hypothetical protein